jgi:hypothetical protein
VSNDFTNGKLSMLHLNCKKPVVIANSNGEITVSPSEQIIALLDELYGPITVQSYLLPDSTAAMNEIVYHWIKGNKHVTFINSSYTNMNMKEFKSTKNEVQELEVKKDLEESQKKSSLSNGKTIKEDFK